MLVVSSSTAATGCRFNAYDQRCRSRPCRQEGIAPTTAPPVSSHSTPARTNKQGDSKPQDTLRRADRKSTRLNSSHANISYAVFCLKKKKQKLIIKTT